MGCTARGSQTQLRKRIDLAWRSDDSIYVGAGIERTPDPYTRTGQGAQSGWRVSERHLSVRRLERELGAVVPQDSVHDGATINAHDSKAADEKRVRIGLESNPNL